MSEHTRRATTTAPPAEPPAMAAVLLSDGLEVAVAELLVVPVALPVGVEDEAEGTAVFEAEPESK